MSTMKSTTLAVFFFLGLQPLSNAQRFSPSVGDSTAAAIMPVQYIPNSVVDYHGNLFIFQSLYQKMVLSTRVTVVPAKATITYREYPGSFSSIVVGTLAIYAINTTAASTSTGTSPTSLIDLVALKLGSTGDLPAVLPSFRFDAYGEIQLALGQSPDLLYLIQRGPAILRPTLIPVVPENFVRLIKFDGSQFADQGKVQLP